jgi:uncharacterized protein Ytp1
VPAILTIGDSTRFSGTKISTNVALLIQCGMLLESRRVKEWLNKTVIRSSSHSPDLAWRVPDTQTISLNPMPALIILLLGTMMGSHHQAKMISSMVHKQWGMLLAAGALARVATYILLYVKPPISYLPSRPPSEVVAAFCLISGGLIFMLSVSSSRLSLGKFVKSANTASQRHLISLMSWIITNWMRCLFSMLQWALQLSLWPGKSWL